MNESLGRMQRAFEPEVDEDIAVKPAYGSACNDSGHFVRPTPCGGASNSLFTSNVGIRKGFSFISDIVKVPCRTPLC
jgi:hypothetical protein